MAELGRALRRGKWLILGVTLCLLVPAVWYAFGASPSYRATALLLIEGGKSRIVSIEDVYSLGVTGRENLMTQVEFLKSRNVLERVVDKLSLETHPDFDPRQRVPGPLEPLARQFFGSKSPDLQEQELTPAQVRNSVLDTLEDNLAVEPVRLSQMLRVSFTAKNPEVAAAVANAVVENYIQADLDVKYSMTVQATTWLSRQAEKLQAQLAASERALQAFRERKGLIDKQTQLQGGVGRQLEALTQQLVEARVRRTQAEQVYQQVRRGQALESAPAVLADDGVQRARELRTRARQRLAELSEHYGNAHPLYQTAAAELQAAEISVRQAVETVVSAVEKEYNAARAVEASMVDAVERFQKSIQSLNREEFELAAYEREVNANRQLLERFLAREKETTISADTHAAAGRIVDPAVPDWRPVKPQKAQIIALALVFGSLLGAVLAFLRERSIQTIDSVEAAESRFKCDVLASVPQLRRRDRQKSSRMISVAPHSIFSESIRTIRTAVLLAHAGQSTPVIAVSSSLPGEGKSTVSFNLAQSLAQMSKTLYVECDLRRPFLSERKGEPLTGPGLADVLKGSVPFEEAVRAIPGSKLHVLTAGVRVSNPLEILSSGEFRKLVASVAGTYEAVILDTPPVAVVSDAVVVATNATSVIFVIKADGTPSKLIQRSLDTLKATDAPVLGLVVNQLDLSKAEQYYGEYSGTADSGYSDAYRT